jgi:hypothetical protein
VADLTSDSHIDGQRSPAAAHAHIGRLVQRMSVRRPSLFLVLRRRFPYCSVQDTESVCHQGETVARREQILAGRHRSWYPTLGASPRESVPQSCSDGGLIPSFSEQIRQHWRLSRRRVILGKHKR